MPKLASINKSKLLKIYKKCVYCNSKDDLTVEHIILKSKAKEYKLPYRKINSEGNLVVACRKCNEEKGGKIPKLFFLFFHYL